MTRQFYWMADDFEVDDTRYALEAAENMARRFKTDVVILFDLRTKFADEHEGNYLEIIKYEELCPETPRASRGV